MQLTRADERQLEAWWQEAAARRGALPAGLEPVHARLVRTVGRGALADAGPVHVKIMAFPRARDRLRYLHRALPARHEARLLAAVRAAGIAAPEVVAARTARRCGWPRLSMLVTRTLPAHGGAPAPAAIARVAAALAAAGVHHPDLHDGNFLDQGAGRVAVVDLQSARLRRGALRRRARRAMAARLLAGSPACDPALLAAHGLIDARDGDAVQALALELQRRALVRRIWRCLCTSTEFVVERRWTGALHRRRGAALGAVRRGGAELCRCWIGERTREVLDGEQPQLAALFKRYWWFPGRHSLYIRADRHAAPARTVSLLEGFARFAALRHRRPSAVPSPPSAPWSPAPGDTPGAAPDPR